MSISFEFEVVLDHIDLRTGLPYARLISAQGVYANEVGRAFKIDPDCIVTMAGATGAIEAVRNHIFKTVLKRNPVVLTVTPGYWRMRETLVGFGFQVSEVHTERHNFTIYEQEIIEQVKKVRPDVIYLSLPNNPTGAIFDPEIIVSQIPQDIPIIFDLTLPRVDTEVGELYQKLHSRFEGKENLFLVGSTSKSHSTAEYRIGWVICASRQTAQTLVKENRNSISLTAIKEGIRQLNKPATATGKIARSFALLRNGEGMCYQIVRPARMVETCYVLINLNINPIQLKESFQRHRLQVMWGAEFGLTDEYIRVEMLAPENIEPFVQLVNNC
ncbi:MAG: aminotransferase class I/II-fold pyridoxal phosphate-dependent enzyme [Acidobacteriota bacterium]